MKRGPRLVVRIYLFTLASVLLVPFCLFSVMRFGFEPPAEISDHSAYFVRQVTSGATLAQWRAELGQLPASAVLALYRPGGELVMSNGDVQAPLTAEQERQLGRVPLALYDGRVVVPLGSEHAAYAVVAPLRPRFNADRAAVLLFTMLLIVSVPSAMFARHLATPIRRLSAAARALGGGDLTARVQSERTDELGALADAFNDMADHTSQVVRSQKELLASVAHELRSPLACIYVALDIAQEGDLEQTRKSLTEIAADLAELERLIDDTLATSRLDTEINGGLPPLRRTTVDVQTLVDTVAARFRSSHPRHDLRVTLAAMPGLDVDLVLVRRALDNVCDNAGKYSEPGSTVELSAALQGGHVVFDVVDRGIGIATEDVPLVGTPFFRTDRSRTRGTGGVGLGLALARRIAEAHGGRLEIKSSMANGTAVRLSLGFRPAAATATTTAQSATIGTQSDDRG
ncbi:MAG: HAMP domain-containing sensor histidine kinase [Deltaproteobacteria bacterium]|nr:HAMP domain-containing sensor histidine kinase [Deltaproteobacteria bacterium]